MTCRVNLLLEWELNNSVLRQGSWHEPRRRFYETGIDDPIAIGFGFLKIILEVLYVD